MLELESAVTERKNSLERLEADLSIKQYKDHKKY